SSRRRHTSFYRDWSSDVCSSDLVMTPVGTSLDATDRAFRQAEAFLGTRPEVERVFGVIGGFGGGEVNTGMMFITLKEAGDRPRRPEARSGGKESRIRRRAAHLYR